MISVFRFLSCWALCGFEFSWSTASFRFLFWWPAIQTSETFSRLWKKHRQSSYLRRLKQLHSCVFFCGCYSIFYLWSSHLKCNLWLLFELKPMMIVLSLLRWLFTGITCDCLSMDWFCVRLHCVFFFLFNDHQRVWKLCEAGGIVTPMHNQKTVSSCEMSVLTILLPLRRGEQQQSETAGFVSSRKKKCIFSLLKSKKSAFQLHLLIIDLLVLYSDVYWWTAPRNLWLTDFSYHALTLYYWQQEGESQTIFMASQEERCHRRTFALVVRQSPVQSSAWLTQSSLQQANV